MQVVESGEHIVKRVSEKAKISWLHIITGILAGVLYWIAESFIHNFHFPGQGLMAHIIPDQPHVCTARLFFAFIFMLFGIFIHYLLSGRKNIEKAFSDSEVRYRALVEALNDIVFILDTKGRFIYLNPEAEKDLGYKRDDLINRHFQEILSPECRKSALDNFQRGLSGEKLPPYEVDIISRKGDKFRFEVKVVTMFDDTGNPAGRLGIARNITRRKEVETALRESEEKFRVLADSTPTAIMLYQDDKWIYANPAAQDISGYPQDELLEMNFWDIVHPDYKDLIKQRGESRQKGKPAERRYEFKIVCKNGQEKWVDLSGASTVLDGKPAGIISVIDITQRKNSEEAMRLSEEKYRTILENIEDIYFELDLAGYVVFFNDQLCRISGYTREELAGMNFTQFTKAGWQKYLYERFKDIYKTGKPIKQLEWEAVTKSGDCVYIEISVTLKKNREGKSVGFHGIARDITERKRLEAQLVQAKRMESLGTLAGGIAHDFNNLLMAIQGNTALMYSDISTAHPCNRHLQNIEKCIQSGAKLTQQLLGFARGGKYEVKAIDINSLIEKTSSMFSHTKKEMVIHKIYESRNCIVDADQGQLEQVLLNLYVNAWQAMPSGGDLFISSRIVFLDEDFAEPHHVPAGRYVMVAVRDTGIGIDENIKHRLFEPFFTTKNMARASGLGLASAYGIIQNHNGFITVASEKGKGSTFSIYLPLSEKNADEETAPEKGDVLSGTETILLIDDEKMITEVGTSILKYLGYKVFTANNGQEAIDIFKAHQNEIDAVILDMIMPGMGGGDVFDRLKAVRNDIRVILSSGYSLDGEAERIFKRGCRGFIQKPFNIKTLSIKIREALDNSQAK